MALRFRTGVIAGTTAATPSSGSRPRNATLDPKDTCCRATVDHPGLHKSALRTNTVIAAKVAEMVTVEDDLPLTGTD